MEFPSNQTPFKSSNIDTNPKLKNTKIVKSSSTRIYTCHICMATFPYLRKMRRHQMSEHERRNHYCPECKKSFSRQDAVTRHRKTHDTKLKVTPLKHKSSHDNKGEGSTKRYESINPSTMSSCLNTFFTYTTTPKEATSYDLALFLNASREEIIRIIEETSSEQRRGAKWYINACVRMIRKISENEKETISPHFRSNCMITLLGESLNDKIDEAIKKVLHSYEEFQAQGSGWLLDQILYLETKVAVYDPLYKS